jgi:hypothetical protein
MEKIQQMCELIEIDPLATVKSCNTVCDDSGRITSFKWLGPQKRSGHYIYEDLEDLSLETFSEEMFFTDPSERNAVEEDGWTSEEEFDIDWRSSEKDDST